jgi:hypothetical protein
MKVVDLIKQPTKVTQLGSTPHVKQQDKNRSFQRNFSISPYAALRQQAQMNMDNRTGIVQNLGNTVPTSYTTEEDGDAGLVVKNKIPILLTDFEFGATNTVSIGVSIDFKIYFYHENGDLGRAIYSASISIPSDANKTIYNITDFIADFSLLLMPGKYVIMFKNLGTKIDMYYDASPDFSDYKNNYFVQLKGSVRGTSLDYADVTEAYWYYVFNLEFKTLPEDLDLGVLDDSVRTTMISNKRLLKGAKFLYPHDCSGTTQWRQIIVLTDTSGDLEQKTVYPENPACPI